MRASSLIPVLVVVAACGGNDSRTATSSTAQGGTGGGESAAAEATASVPILRDSRRPSNAEGIEIGRLVALTAETRGLAVERPIAVRIASTAVVAAHLVSTIDEDELRELVDLYVAIGLLDRGTDVASVLAAVVSEQVVGFYDPDLDVLVIREDVMESFALTGAMDPEALVTIVHEVVHALQGQHLDLRARMDADDDIDFADAYQALVEGDATLGMLLVAAKIRRLPIDEILAAMPIDLDAAIRSTSAGSGHVETEQLEAAPPIIRIGLVAPYVTGLAFCARLYRDGGLAAIDAAHGARPLSTEQIIHPEKYRSHEAPDAIDLGEIPELSAAGYSVVRDHTLGELELGIYLGRGTAGGFDAAAAAGWGGDRVRVFRRGDALAAMIVASFDTEADAREAEAAIARSTDPTRIIQRIGRVLLAFHGLEGALLDAAKARAVVIANELPRRTR